MLRLLHPLLGYDVYASDGLVGKVHDFYFDDKTWRLRHLDVHTGDRFVRSGVLLPPGKIKGVDQAHGVLKITITKKKALECPAEGADKPVHQQFEEQASGLHVLAPHWTTRYGFPDVKPDLVVTGDPHLRSVRHLVGYAVDVSDGRAGHLSDFIMDDTAWDIPFLVLEGDVGGTKRQVLVPSGKIERFDWEHSTISINLEKGALKMAPVFDPDHLNDKSLRKKVPAYYKLHQPANHGRKQSSRRA